MCQKFNLDDLARLATIERVNEISMDLTKRIVYFAAKNYNPLEVLMGGMKFVAIGIVALSEKDPQTEKRLVDALGTMVRLFKDGGMGATWPDGTKVEL